MQQSFDCGITSAELTQSQEPRPPGIERCCDLPKSATAPFEILCVSSEVFVVATKPHKRSHLRSLLQEFPGLADAAGIRQTGCSFLNGIDAADATA